MKDEFDILFKVDPYQSQAQVWQLISETLVNPEVRILWSMLQQYPNVITNVATSGHISSFSK
jgi:hypothetical protein